MIFNHLNKPEQRSHHDEKNCPVICRLLHGCNPHECFCSRNLNLLVPAGLGRFLNKGWFRLGQTLMYITSGLPYFTVRLGKTGEILRLTIKPGREKQNAAKIENPT